MSRARLNRWSCVAVLTLLLGEICSAQEVDKNSKNRASETQTLQASTGETATRTRRVVYPARYASAHELAKVLSAHFKGDAEIQAVPDAATNFLLISANPAVFDEVLKTLALLDRQPRVLVIEVIVAEIGPEDGAPALELHSLTGPVAEVDKKIRELRLSGAITLARRMRVTAVENLSTQYQTGDEALVVRGVTTNQQTRISVPNLMPRQVGTIVQVTPRIEDEHVAVLELTVRDDRLITPTDAKVLGTGEKGPIVAQEVRSSNIKTSLRVRIGESVLADASSGNSKSGDSRTVFIVSAQFESSAATAKPK